MSRTDLAGVGETLVELVVAPGARVAGAAETLETTLQVPEANTGVQAVGAWSPADPPVTDVVVLLALVHVLHAGGARPARGAGALEPGALHVGAGAAVAAGLRRALVHLQQAGVSGEAGGAPALVGLHQVHALLTLLARHPQAVVDVLLGRGGKLVEEVGGKGTQHTE